MPAAARDDLRPPGRPSDPVAELLLQLPRDQLPVPRRCDPQPPQHGPDRSVLRRCQVRQPSRVRDHRPRLRAPTPGRTRKTSCTPRCSPPRSSRPSWTPRPGRARCWYGPSMKAAATTTTCRHLRPSRRTTSGRTGLRLPIRVRPVRVPGAGGGGVPMEPARSRDQRRARPHLDPGHGRTQVEPAGADTTATPPPRTCPTSST